MYHVLNALPGISMPVSEINKQISDIWKSDAIGEDNSHASQMNLVLHFGVKTTADEAKIYFDAAIEFSQRYPARLIILCPGEKEGSGMELDAKFFFQCYVGGSHRERCCCEAFMLGYEPKQSEFLKNQVSVWLQSDLPTYHWFHKVPASRVEDQYLKFVKNAKRVVYDSTIDPDLAEVQWDKTYRAKDLASARLLTARQSLGQFLSGYSPEEIVEGIQSIKSTYSSDLRGEGKVICNWVKDCLYECDSESDFEIYYDENSDYSGQIVLEFSYEDTKKCFKWEFSSAKSFASISANLGKGDVEFQHTVKLLDADKALSEALFF